MNIKLNGKPYECSAVNVQALTQALGLNPTQVAIERNREIVPRSRYEQTLLTADDEIEIVHFIGGG